MALQEGEREPVLAAVDHVVGPARQHVHLGHGLGVRLEHRLHGAPARPVRDDLVVVAVHEQGRDAGDGRRVDRVVALEEGQPPAHEARHRGEAVRHPRGVEERAGAAVAEAGDRDAVGVHVQVGERFREERRHRRRGLLVPPHAVRLREEGQRAARLERRASGLRGGDGAAGAPAENDDEGEGLVAAVVVGDVEDVGPAAEALGAHEAQRRARHLAGRALGEERLPAPAGFDGPGPRRQLPAGAHGAREADEGVGRLGTWAQESPGERRDPRRIAPGEPAQDVGRRGRKPVTPGHGQHQALDVGLGPVQQRVERFRGEVQPVRGLERGESAARGLRLVQPRGEGFSSRERDALEPVVLLHLGPAGAAVLRLVLQAAERAARRAMPVADREAGSPALEAQALLAADGLEAGRLHREAEQVRRGERAAGGDGRGRERLDLVEERQPLARGLARGGPRQQRRSRRREPARLREGRPPLRQRLGERGPLGLQPVPAVLAVAQERSARAVALDADSPRAATLVEHQQVALPLRLRPRVDARRAVRPLQPLLVDEVVPRSQVVAKRERRRGGRTRLRAPPRGPA